MSEICHFCDRIESLPLEESDEMMLNGLDPSINIVHHVASKICLLCRNELIIAYNFKRKYLEVIEKYQINTEESSDDINLNNNEYNNKVVIKKPPINVTGIVGGEQKKPFKCHICHRRFRLKGALKGHVEKHQTKETSYKCKKCPLQFLCKPHFEQHACLDSSVKKKVKKTTLPKATKSVTKTKTNNGNTLVPRFSKRIIKPERIDDAHRQYEYEHPNDQFPELDSCNDAGNESGEAQPSTSTPIVFKPTIHEAPVAYENESKAKNQTKEIINGQKPSTLKKHPSNTSKGYSSYDESAEPNADLAYNGCNGSSLTEHDLGIPENRKHKMRLRKPSQNFKRLMSTLRKKPKRELMPQTFNVNDELKISKYLPNCRIDLDRTIELDLMAMHTIENELQQIYLPTNAEETGYVEVPIEELTEDSMDTPAEISDKINDGCVKDTAETAEEDSTLIDQIPLLQPQIEIPPLPASEQATNGINQEMITSKVLTYAYGENSMIYGQQFFQESSKFGDFIIEEVVQHANRSNGEKTSSNEDDEGEVKCVPNPAEDIEFSYYNEDSNSEMDNSQSSQNSIISID